MPNYLDGKIYKLVTPHTDNIYIGSTTKKLLCQRKAKHKSDYVRWKQGKAGNVSSFELYELGADDVNIVLIESFPCNNKDELCARERHHLENSLNCVNKTIPYREKGETNKLQYEKNKTKILEQSKIYQQNNQEKIRERRKKYRDNNKEIIQEKKKLLQHCDICDCDVTKNHFKRHTRSKLHIQNSNKQN